MFLVNLHDGCVMVFGTKIVVFVDDPKTCSILWSPYFKLITRCELVIVHEIP